MSFVYNYEKRGHLQPFHHVTLLSALPRRKALLAFLNPDICPVTIDERVIEEQFMGLFADKDFLTRTAMTCCEISKAKSNRPLSEGTLYISADTIVASEDAILNKPANLVQAKQMLLSYLGKSHYVVTSVCLRTTDYLDVFYTLAEVTFSPYYPALETVIDDYVHQKQPLDKAGAYGIQELDPRLISKISGDLHTIIGFPVAETSLRLFGGQETSNS
ncbi:Maf family protein [Streptococcus rifensis]